MTDLINTPEEYLSQVNYDLQTKLGIKDTKLLSSGAISVLANMLANVAYDAQKYYEYVSEELNVATAQNFKSMLFHASVYSYDFNLAIPSQVAAYIKIPKTTVDSNRKIKYTITSFSNFTINDALFRIEGEVNVEITSTDITAVLTDGVGTYTLDVIDGVDDNNLPVYYIAVPSDKIHQIERLIDKFVVPSYNIGDTVSYNISIPDEKQVYIMKTYVNYSDQPSFDTTLLEKTPISAISTLYPNLDEYQLKYFKFNTSFVEKAIFANLSSYQNITFTLGNGIYGHKLDTNDEVITLVEYTLGAAGNVPAGISQLENIYYYEVDINTGDTVVFTVLNLEIKTEMPANGGLAASDIEDIRYGILNKITERESLITRIDFEKYFADPVTNKLATVMSYQVSTMPPTVSVYNVLRDPYSYEIIDSTTYNVPYDDCFSVNPWKVSPVITYAGIDMISPFIYIDYNNQITSYYKYNTVSIPLTVDYIASDPGVTVELSIEWDETTEQFYFVSNDVGDTYKISIYSSVGNYDLTSDNGFRIAIDNDGLIYNRFFNEDIQFTNVNLVELATSTTAHRYNVVDNITVMTQIQNHAAYTFTDDIKRVLKMPFVAQTFYDNFSDSRYEDTFVNYFTISTDDIKSKIAFNLTANQSLANTVDVDAVVQSGVIINDNDSLIAKYPVDIDVIYNLTELSTSGLTLTDLKTDISLAILEYLTANEGDGIEIYTTSIVKLIKGMYPDIVKEVTVNSPKTLVTKDWNTVLESSVFDVDDVLNSTPTYFHFDLNNMDIKFIIG